MLLQEAFEANSVAAEKRYMRTRHAEISKTKPGRHMSTDAQTDMQPERLCSVVFDLTVQQRMHVLPKPVYAVSPDGTKATSFDFDRLDAVEAGTLVPVPISPHVPLASCLRLSCVCLT